ncbi:MAG: hypothetical protein GF317_11235 [Candidatus Lokiarchaeota archaeon]|nr:hypothetical protein [Candidatus Lokiarchaeota archaeon]MBD3200222.1 hypothetical protein [Candidatus Lokiarchaeota archaeon]
METKDGIIGILIIALIGLGGGLGFIILTGSQTPTGPTTPTYSSGLPDDWSTALNSSYFMFSNQTHSDIMVNLSFILEKVAIGLNAEKYYEDPGMGLKTIVEPNTGIPVTGIHLLDLLYYMNTPFPGQLSFDLYSADAKEIVNKIENKDIEEDVIIAIAANKQWLAESPLGESWGNFSLVGEDTGVQVINIKEMAVEDYWEVDVYVDGQFKFSMDPSNISSAPSTTYDYGYQDNDDWNFNRSVTGLNLSTICKWAGMDESKNFEVRAIAVDGFSTPFPWKPALSTSDVYNGLEQSSSNWGRVNTTWVKLPADINDGKPIIISYKQQLLGEQNPSGVQNPKWVNGPQTWGVKYGPYQLIIPGMTRSGLVGMITQINIDTVPIADFEANQTSISTGDWVRFDFNGTIHNGPVNQTFWTFNSSDINVTATNNYVEWQFTSPGNYTISLEVQDQDGSWSKPKTREEYIKVV